MNEDFPKLEVVRKVKKDGAKYFGPYFNINPNEIINAVNYAYPVRTCSKKIKDNNKMHRACLNYSLGLCSAPCMCKITKEEYRNLLPKVYDFLSGREDAVYKVICEKMEQAVGLENFELAIKLRDLKIMLTRLKERSVTALTNTANIDVFGLAKSDLFYVFSVLIIRDGKMMGVKHFNFDNSQIDDEQMLISFLTQYYMMSNILPDKILLPIHIDIEDALFKELSKRHGKNIEVVVGEKGANKQLLNQAKNNAEEYLTKNCELDIKKKSK